MPSDPRYPELVAALEKRHMMPERPPGLETTREGLRRLALAIDPARVILVAGTNGKGSTAAALERLLISAGGRVGLYTSPHLVETTERFRIDGADIDETTFVRAHDSVQERLGDLEPTHFEMLTLMAVWLFGSGELAPPVDWLILEVGLGGRWDATNAVPHSTAIVTRIGRDHENLLGRALGEIAGNKLDTVPHGGLLVHGSLADPSEPEAQAVDQLARETALERSARVVTSPDFGWRPAPDVPLRAILESRWGEVHLPLPGRRAAENCNLALAAFEALGFDPHRHLSALERIRWPGRMQPAEISEAPCPVYLSGDHNPQGIRSLLELLPRFRAPTGRVHFVVGIGLDKDADEMLGILSAVEDSRLYLTVTPFKGRALEQYGSWLERASGAEADPLRALGLALRAAGREDLIVITGSLYLVGEYLGQWRQVKTLRPQAATLNSSRTR